MSHLTQILIPFDLAARLRLRDAYDWHQKAWQCFPGRDGQPRDFLTRLDDGTGFSDALRNRLRDLGFSSDGYRLLILSAQPASRPPWLPSEPVELFQTKAVPPEFFARQRYLFQLRANPTKKLRTANADGGRRKNGRRVPLRTRDELLAWLQRKGNEAGFSFDPAGIRILPRGPEHFQKKGASGTHTSADFAGILEVIDAGKFRQIFHGCPDPNDPQRRIYGIGSAKAFGFGLLAIAPVSQ